MMQIIIDEFKAGKEEILKLAGNAGNISYKADDSPVTELDQIIENRVIQAMNSVFSDVLVFGEESGYATQDLHGLCWLIDPIDGTASFIEGIPTFTSMAVLVEKKQPIASIIYNPSIDDLFTTIRGEGAFKNGGRLNLRQKPLPKEALCKGRYTTALDKLLAPLDITCRVGAVGAGYGFSQIAEGLYAARFQFNSNGYPHDYATGALLVEEAGGEIVLINDTKKDVMLRSFIACHPELAPLLRSEIDLLRAIESSPS